MQLSIIMQLIHQVIRYGLYPFLLIATGFLSWNSITRHIDLGTTFISISAGRFILLQAIELLFPCKKQWGINWLNLWRDIKYGFANYGALKSMPFISAIITIQLADTNPGLIQGAPLLVEIIIAALLFEFMQYWFHRACHESKGWLGDKLWKVHVAHHLPDRVYLIMHAVGHPINLMITLWMVPITTWLLGVSQEAVMVWFAFRSLHGLLSHYNVDIRAGWLNYLFIGTELHRYHHSASVDEAKNYGSFLAIWDQIFGTFVYRPGKHPEQLGVADPKLYPDSNSIGQVLLLPFRKST